MTTHIHTATLFPPTAPGALGLHGFTCDRCAGQWVYYTVTEAEAHAKRHEETA